MAKRSKEKNPAPLADWVVTLDPPGWDGEPHTQVIESSRWKRTGRGWYTFRDEHGTVAEYAPGAVLSVRRQTRVSSNEALDALRRKLSGEDETRQSGYELTRSK